MTSKLRIATHCHDKAFEAAVLASLQGGLVELLQDGPANTPLLFLLDAVCPEALQALNDTSQRSPGRVLVLVKDSAGMPQSDAWQLLHAGAADVFSWDRSEQVLGALLARLERWRRVDELVESPLVSNNLVGASRVWKNTLRQVIEAALFTQKPVVLMGETGTGKELTARLLHTLDPQRRQHNMVIQDCTTIVAELSGSELFGHERGAYTGAHAGRDGAFALAHGGTLFLDEVGELPANLQVQLLRVIQEGTYKRVGSNVWQKSDFRLVCATNRDLEDEVESGAFRRDLYYRISAFKIRLPPLCERIQDIEPLVRHFIKAEYAGGDLPALDERVLAYLQSRKYPGNVRDLKNLVQRMLVRYAGVGPLTLGDIPESERPLINARQAGGYLQDFEAPLRRALSTGISISLLTRQLRSQAIRLMVEDAGGVLSKAASKTGYGKRTLQKWRRQENV